MTPYTLADLIEEINSREYTRKFQLACRGEVTLTQDELRAESNSRDYSPAFREACAACDLSPFDLIEAMLRAGSASRH